MAAGSSVSSAARFSLVDGPEAEAADAPNEKPEKGDATVDGAVDDVEVAGLEKEKLEKGVDAGAGVGSGAVA